MGRARAGRGEGGGEREKTRNRGKEGTPAGRAEGEAEAKLGWGAAAPARACGRARVTRRARATRVPRRPAAAAAAARSAPGCALARPRRGAARGRWVQPERPCAPASLCASLAQPLFACLCASPRQSPRRPGGEGGDGTVWARRAPSSSQLGRPPPLSLPGSLLSLLSELPPPGLPAPPSPSVSPPGLASPPALRTQPSPRLPWLFRGPPQSASLPAGPALGFTCCLFSSQTGPLTLPPLSTSSLTLSGTPGSNLSPSRSGCKVWDRALGSGVLDSSTWASSPPSPTRAVQKRTP